MCCGQDELLKAAQFSKANNVRALRKEQQKLKEQVAATARPTTPGGLFVSFKPISGKLLSIELKHGTSTTVARFVQEIQSRYVSDAAVLCVGRAQH